MYSLMRGMIIREELMISISSCRRSSKELLLSISLLRGNNSFIKLWLPMSSIIISYFFIRFHIAFLIIIIKIYGILILNCMSLMMYLLLICRLSLFSLKTFFNLIKLIMRIHKYKANLRMNKIMLILLIR